MFNIRFVVVMLVAELVVLLEPSLGQIFSAYAASPTSVTPFYAVPFYRTPYYKLAVVARSDAGDFASFSRDVSINDGGAVAFVAQLDSSGEGVFASTGPDGALQHYTEGFVRSTRSFSPAVKINNSNEVVARDLLAGTGAEPPFTFVRVWKEPGISFEIASGKGTLGDYDSVFSHPSINNSGDVVYSARRHDGSTALATWDSATAETRAITLNIPLRPVIADDGRVITRSSIQPTSPILLYGPDLATNERVATGADGFTRMGVRPGVADDGQLAVFYGELNDAGATAVGTSPGPGIFASFVTGGSRVLRRVAGVAGNGEVDPGETCVDANKSTTCEAGETDVGPFSGFDGDARVSVTNMRDGSATVAYTALDSTDGPVPKRAIYTSRITVTGGGVLRVEKPSLVIRVGDALPGMDEVVADVSAFDSISNSGHGEVAFWGQMSTGTQVVVRATADSCEDNAYRFPDSGPYINQYDAGVHHNLPTAAVDKKRGGNACGPSSFVRLYNAIMIASGDARRYSIADAYQKTMVKAPADGISNDFDPKLAQVALSETFGPGNVYLGTGKTFIDSHLALGRAVIASTAFGGRSYTCPDAPGAKCQEKSQGPFAGGHIVLIRGRTPQGDYIVDDPSGDYFASARDHYGAGRCGAGVVYPAAEMERFLKRYADDGMTETSSGRGAVAVNFVLPPDPEMLSVIGRFDGERPRPFELWLEDAEGRRSGFLPNGSEVEEIPGSSADIDPVLPSDPEVDPVTGSPDAWPYAVSVASPQPGLRVFVHGREDSTFSLDLRRFVAGGLETTPVVGSVLARETKAFDISAPTPGSPPSATPDAYATDVGAPLTVPAPGVLANDTDPDPGDTLTAVLAAGPANGTLILNGDGSFTYTPNAGFSGVDTFRYRAKDPIGASSDEAVATISVRKSPPVPCASVSFATTFAPLTDTATGPQGVAFGDLNGDGRADMVVTSYRPDAEAALLVLLGDGAGAFGPATTIRLGPLPAGVLLADFNGDGKLDAGVARLGFGDDGAVSILLGTGTGTFGAPTDFPAGRSPTALATGDLNGDGKLDLVVSHVFPDGGTVSLLTGNGTGGFSAPTSLALPGFASSSSLVVADLTGDSRPDIALGHGSPNGVALFTNSGGTFTAAQVFPVAAAVWDVAGGDLDSDGALDLVVGHKEANTVSILRGNGSGGFGAATTVAVGANARSVNLADFNSDGRLDLATASEWAEGPVAVMLGKGDGTFQAASTFPLAPDTVRPRVSAGESTVGDINGDGRPDLAVLRGFVGNVAVLRNTCGAAGLVAPAITSANAATFTVGAPGTFTVTATGTPTPALSMTGALPDGVTFNAATGVLAGTPAAGNAGSYPLTFTAANGSGPDATQGFTLTVAPAPVAPAITSANATTFTVGAPGSFTVTATGSPAPTLSGTGALPAGVSFNAATGVLAGTPAAGTAGSYPLVFTAANGSGPDATQSFTLTVVPAPVAPAITSADATTFTVGAPGTFTVTATGTPAPTLSGTGALPVGVSFNAATGVLAGTPAAGTAGSYPLTFTAANGSGPDATQGFTLTVRSPNEPPVARDDAHATDEDTALVVPAPGVLVNDTDVDGDALTASLTTTPAHGTVVLNADGSFTYTPAPDYFGPDLFSYRADDGSAGATATVNLTVRAVNDAPVANDATLVTDEDTAASGRLSARDADGDHVSFTIVRPPAHGSLGPITPAACTPGVGSDCPVFTTYTPARDYAGPDSFTYVATDASGARSGEATVTITVRAVNDAPTAANDTYATDAGKALIVPAPGVLGNDADADGDVLNAEVGRAPAHGTVTLNADGSFTYTPASGYSGPDSFTYRALDPAGARSVETTATIDVRGDNRPPTCATVRVDLPRIGPLGATLALLWPPDHSFRPVTLVGGSDPDGDPVTIAVTGVTQDEALNGTGDGDTSPDAKRTSLSNQVQLRAERAGNGDGRVYRISFTVTDIKGAVCIGVVKVGVPKALSLLFGTPVESRLVVNSFGG